MNLQHRGLTPIVPHRILAQLILSYTYGQVVQWLGTQDEQAYWSTLLAGIDGAVLLADPRPVGDPHPDPAPRDYDAAVVPRSRDHSASRPQPWPGSSGTARPASGVPSPPA